MSGLFQGAHVFIATFGQGLLDTLGFIPLLLRQVTWLNMLLLSVADSLNFLTSYGESLIGHTAYLGTTTCSLIGLCFALVVVFYLCTGTDIIRNRLFVSRRRCTCNVCLFNTPCICGQVVHASPEEKAAAEKFARSWAFASPENPDYLPGFPEELRRDFKFCEECEPAMRRLIRPEEGETRSVAETLDFLAGGHSNSWTNNTENARPSTSRNGYLCSQEKSRSADIRSENSEASSDSGEDEEENAEVGLESSRVENDLGEKTPETRINADCRNCPFANGCGQVKGGCGTRRRVFKGPKGAMKG